MFLLLMFFCGSIFGSYIACHQFRLMLREHRSKRSICDYCKHPLTLFELIPLLSFVFLHGTCRYCQNKIKSRYFIIELLSAFIFLVLAWRLSSLSLLLTLIISIPLLMLAIDDYLTQTVSDGDQLLFGFAALLFAFFIPTPTLLNRCSSALLFGSILFILHYLKPSSLGSGDIPFVTIAAFSQGLILYSRSFLLGLILALIVSLVILFSSGKSYKSLRIPLIPFLAAGMWLAWLIWPELITASI